MKDSIGEERRILEAQGFHRWTKCGDIVRQTHENRNAIDGHKDRTIFKKAYEWLFVPMSLWPFDIDSFVRHALGLILDGKNIPTGLALVAEQLGPIPDPKLSETVREHELSVEKGSYESFLKNPAKYAELEKSISQDPEFLKAWVEFRKKWPVERFQNSLGIVRRDMVQERNFRSLEKSNWSQNKCRFKAAFNAFCKKWALYGMQGDSPLPLKLTVNMTPYGTMIFLPHNWSIDGNRDINWSTVNRFHRSRKVKRQGTKMSPARVEREEEKKRVRRLNAEAIQMGLRGDRKYEWIIKKMKWHPETDPRKIRRYLSAK